MIFQNLISTLKDEQMFDAVDTIAKEVITLGDRLDQQKFKANALLVIGEIASEEHIEYSDKVSAGIQQLLEANEIY